MVLSQSGTRDQQKLHIGDAGERGIVLKPHEAQPVYLAGSILVKGGGDPPVIIVSVRIQGSAEAL